MATCPTIAELEAYFDGELSADRSAEVRRHLATCAACVTELARIEGSAQLFRDAPAPRLSQIAVHRLHAALDKTISQERAKELAMRRIARAFSAVAACIVLAGSVWLTSVRKDTPALAAPPWTDVALVVDSNDASATASATASGLALAEYYLVDATGRGSDDQPN